MHDFYLNEILPKKLKSSEKKTHDFYLNEIYQIRNIYTTILSDREWKSPSRVGPTRDKIL